jgi:hypothetical protein
VMPPLATPRQPMRCARAAFDPMSVRACLHLSQDLLGRRSRTGRR